MSSAPKSVLNLARLVDESFVDRIDYQPTLSSTNDRARTLAGEIASATSVLVVADEQTAGRGRGANRWWTGGGSLAFTLLFDPAARGIDRRHASMVSLAAAAAIVDTVAPLLPGHTVGLHWPNDVFVDGRKLAGILVETLPDGRQILGVGLNVNNTLAAAPSELLPVVATLADLTGETHDRTELLVQLLAHLDVALVELAARPAEVGRRIDNLCLQGGLRIEVQAGNRTTSGICAGIAEDGALLVDTPAGRQAVYSGVVVKPAAG